MTRGLLAPEEAATPSTVVVVHDTAAPKGRELMALCPDHLALLQAGVRWAGVDEVVGASRVLPCAACALLDRALPSAPLPVPAARSGGSGGAAP